MKWLLAVALSCAVLVGCSNSGDKIQSRTELEQTIKQQLNDEMRTKGINATVKEVSLVEDGANKFTGFATASDGSQTKLNVTVGADGKAIFEMNPVN